jgi:serine/threonine protein kinase
MEKRKQTPRDYQFGRLIGEGSFSHVFLAREVATKRELAIKVCDKQHIIKEKKTESIQREKRILVKLAAEWNERVPFFVKIYSTFQVSHSRDWPGSSGPQINVHIHTSLGRTHIGYTLS